MAETAATQQALEQECEALRAEVAALRQDNEALAAARQRYQALLAAVPDLIIRLHRDGTYLDFIEAKGIGLVMATAERLGRNVGEVLPKAVADAYLGAVERALASGETQAFDYRLTVRERTGDYEARMVPSGSEEAILVVRDVTERRRAEDALRQEKERSEQLLLNILPRPIAERLKENPDAIAQRFDEATILFADIVHFTELASDAGPLELVAMLNEIFSTFDRLADSFGLEKIKTIGDAYMAVGGLPEPRPDHAEAVAQMALAMQQEMVRYRPRGREPFSIRIGINTGPVVAGVIGMRKFIYDLWGDAVNVASRMESHGQPGTIQVTQATYERLKDRYRFTDRGVIPIKGKGEMRTYFLTGPGDAASAAARSE